MSERGTSKIPTEPQPSSGEVDWAAFGEVWRSQRRIPSRALLTGGVAAAVALWLAALVLAYVSWHSASEEAAVALQIPYLISGGLIVTVLSVAGGSVLVATTIAWARGRDDLDLPAPPPPPER